MDANQIVDSELRAIAMDQYFAHEVPFGFLQNLAEGREYLATGRARSEGTKLLFAAARELKKTKGEPEEYAFVRFVTVLHLPKSVLSTEIIPGVPVGTFGRLMKVTAVTETADPEEQDTAEDES